ncbi:MAG: GTPase RsgA [Bacteroidales bacterium]
MQWVIRLFDGTGTTGVIREIEEQKNYIIRKSSNLSRESQIIAVNIDQAILMVTLPRRLLPEEFIDRYLVSAEAFRIPVIIVFNKIDIYNGDDLAKLDYLVSVYSRIGYRCMVIYHLPEAINRPGLRLIAGRTLVSGNSGVGKSTLLNSVIPGLKIRTKRFLITTNRKTHHACCRNVPDSGSGYIDTPGIKGVRPDRL